jgi:hypothetical protein
MTGGQPYEATTGAFAEAAGAPPLTTAEAEALLLLAKHAARHRDDRRAAPLVCYLAGQAVAGEADAQARTERIRRLADQLAAGSEPEHGA